MFAVKTANGVKTATNQLRWISCFILTEEERIKKLHFNKNEQFAGMIFFDYECYKDPVTGNFVPNLIIASRCCVNCLNAPKKCENCVNPFKFYNNDDFCKWLFQHQHYIALAHNLQAFDGVFIANYCINNRLPDDAFPTILATPTKILQIKFRKLKIIDSYSFLAMPLEKFPKTFGLEELKKGFYAHKFNTPENENYIGNFPDEEYFGTEFFTIAKYEEWIKFYEQNKNRTDYDNKKELHDYCLSDVKILEEGCLKFRKIIMDQTDIDPFRVAITIASLCNYIYRAKYMPKQTIGIIPDQGYQPNLLSSIKCEKWLQYLEYKDNIKIQRKSYLGEKKVGKYFLDGYCETNKKYYKFQGDFWHGCNLPHCPRRR